MGVGVISLTSERENELWAEGREPGVLPRGRGQPKVHWRVTRSRETTSSCCVIPQASVNEPFPGMAQLWQRVRAKDGAVPSSQSKCQGEGKTRVNALEYVPSVPQPQQGSGTF